MTIDLLETWIAFIEDEISEKGAKIEWLREEIEEAKKQREEFIKDLAKLKASACSSR
jgi:predicted RNase H-like nuclease (RuvC/YqgF family)